MTKYIDVDQQAIARKDPAPINIRYIDHKGGHLVRAAFVDILGPAHACHDYVRPKDFGARVWLETEAELVIWDGAMEPRRLV